MTVVLRNKVTTLIIYHGRQGPVQARKSHRGSFGRFGPQSRMGSLATGERSNPGRQSDEGRAH